MLAGTLAMTSRGLGTLAAVTQMTVTNSVKDNLRQAAELIEQAAARGAAMVFLPEAADFIGQSREETGELSQGLGGSTVAALREEAVRHGVWLSLGGLHVREQGRDKISNTHIVVDSLGEVVASYSKTHLFDVTIPGKFSLRESEYVTAGTELVPPVATPLGLLGLGVCYDLRFPEHSQALAGAGAQLLSFPSAFTVATGLAHWEVLLRARAIETQSYVIAAAQVGSHNAKRTSFGHAMIVDPWGTVVAQCREGVGLALAEVDLSYLAEVRANMPVQQQRRPDLYGKVQILAGAREQELPRDEDVFNFGPAKVRGASVFRQSALSLAFVNKKPVVPGHVLIVPRRCVAKLEKLEAEEVRDLFLLVQEVERFLQRHLGVDSTTISIQNGEAAGQSIPHLHVHVLPRRKGDFEENDDVYKELQQHDKVEQGWRSEEDMAEEAAELRAAWQRLMD